ncbi:MAG TPA: choice-of-anchor tandem repeat GloVer-containing protein, partial [Vicinamibacterales bacterium]
GSVALSILHVFTEAEGASARWGITLASDGYLYGTTSNSIQFDTPCVSCGTVFRLSTTGEMTLLHVFSGEYPNGGVMQASDGNLYGSTRLAPNGGGGTVFEIALPSGALTTIATIQGHPFGDLAEDANGGFYLSVQDTNPGVDACGAVFRVTKAGSASEVLDLRTANFCVPTSSVIRGTDGNFYGAARGVFRMTAGGEVTVLHSFPDSNWAKHLIQGSDGALYGLQVSGDTDNGAVFRLDMSGTLTTLHAFHGVDGKIVGGFNNDPPDALMEINGVLVGTAGFRGGLVCVDCGTMFALTRDGAFLGARAYEYSDGGSAVAAMRQFSDGAFYGTSLSGPQAAGEVFRITTSGELTILHSFNGIDGAFPFGGVIEASDGNLYGTASYSAVNVGTVFRLTPDGSFTTLHEFRGSDGAIPASRLLQAADGDLYGTTTAGGAANLGTIFKITRGGVLTLLHSFTGADGAQPFGGLVQASDGLLYGTTKHGGSSDRGVLFVMTTKGLFAPLHSFTGADSEGSLGALTEASDGTLYGTSSAFGSGTGGSIFRTTPSGAFSIVKHVAFDEIAESQYPIGELTRAPDGSLYGTTAEGSFGAVVFNVTPGGQITAIATLPSAEMLGGVTSGSDGALYGVSVASTAERGMGAVYRVDLNAPVAIAGGSGPQ